MIALFTKASGEPGPGHGPPARQLVIGARDGRFAGDLVVAAYVFATSLAIPRPGPQGKITDHELIAEGQVRLVDGTLISCANYPGCAKKSEFAPDAAYGYCSSKSQYVRGRALGLVSRLCTDRYPGWWKPVYPDMHGPEVVEKARVIRPDLKALYMSGYAHQMIAQSDEAGDGNIGFVEKPFTAETLLTAVRGALDTG